jgi:uncharacterized protein with PhoU and TrkA domain
LLPGGASVFGAPSGTDRQLRVVTLPADTAASRRLGDFDLDACGVTVASVLRGDATIPNPDKFLILRGGDMVVLFGTAADLERAEAVLLGK